MAKTIRRRRKEMKTDYKARFVLLKSGKARLVIRKTNKHIIAEIVESHNAQDKVIASFASYQLLDMGWPKEASGSLKSLPAAYLTGYVLIKRLKGKVKDAVLDVGMYRNVHGSRLYAALKGALDAGLNVPHNAKVLPSEERLKSNQKVSALIPKIKESA